MTSRVTSITALFASVLLMSSCVEPLDGPTNPGQSSDQESAGMLDMPADSGTTPVIEEPDLPPPSCTAPEQPCGQTCADTSSDPNNCGGCGRTCIIPDATATCVDGECAILSCQDGYFDRDADITNGCESMDSCMPGAACMTSCQTEGSTVCQNGESSCNPPSEVCNGLDDDCDGGCDTGGLPGCRVGIHRSYGGAGGHLYTSNLLEASTSPYRVERENFFYLYAEAPGAGRFLPVFLCKKPGSGNHYLSTANNCDPNAPRGPVRELGFWATEAFCGSQPLYHAYNAGGDNDFYTTSEGEKNNAVNNLGFQDRGIAGHIWGAP